MKRPEAQAASCLKPTDFVKCYKIVQSATKAEYDAQKGKKKEKEPTTRISGRTSSNNFYDMFIINSAIPGPKSTIIEWVNRAEKLLSLDERVFDTSDVAAKHAVFLWVYKVVQTSHVREVAAVDCFIQSLTSNTITVRPWPKRSHQVRQLEQD